MNIPQQNRKLAILASLRVYNNYEDCDVIQDSMNEIEKAENSVDLIAAIGYAIASVQYRGAVKLAKNLQTLSTQIESYTSLLSAIKNKDQFAIKWWEDQANSGTTVRIM